MSEIAIRVENLSKQYQIGQLHQRHDTLRDALTAGLGRFRRNERQKTHNINDTFWALKDVSFDVKRGEVVGIIGRNGAGKSTLLKILTRITEPTSGRAEIHGRVGSLLEVGTGFHPELTGRENIYLSGTILGMKKTEINRRFDEIVAFSGVEKFIDTPVKRYSSGMNVRLGFAVAAHLEPEVLMVDEVLAVGDAEFQKKCLGKMGNVAKEGRTILFVSHNMSAITRLCNTAILLKGGTITSSGEANGVVSKYISHGSPQSGLMYLDQTNNSSVDIRLVGVVNQNGDFTANIRTDEEFSILIKCDVFEYIENSQISIAILTHDGLPIFASTHADERNIEQLRLSPGKYETKAHIPAHFLNRGTYIVNARVFGRTKSNIRESLSEAFHILEFTIVEADSISGKFNDRRRGMITPLLHWTITKE